MIYTQRAETNGTCLLTRSGHKTQQIKRKHNERQIRWQSNKSNYTERKNNRIDKRHQAKVRRVGYVTNKTNKKKTKQIKLEKIQTSSQYFVLGPPEFTFGAGRFKRHAAILEEL